MNLKYYSPILKFLKLALLLVIVSSIAISNNKALDTVVKDTNTDVVWSMKSPNSRPILGTNVRVAIIDSGIDWTHPSFYNPLMTMSWPVHFNKSGYPYLDIISNGVYDAGEALNYEKIDILHPDGTAYAKASTFDLGIDYLYLDMNGNINRELNEPFFVVDDQDLDKKLSAKDIAYPLALPKIEKIFDIPNNKQYERGVDLTDPNINAQVDTDGHGTHVAGILAGGNPGFTKFTGIAPNATLLIA
ncbi:MAG: S8 family serine peptidase, partial [Candidatus Kariarchaeaceae archaeon]